MINTRRLNSLVTGIGCVIALGLFAIRVIPQMGYAPVGAHYSVNVEYAPLDMIVTGRLIESADVPQVSNYTSGVDYGRIDFLYVFLHAFLLQMIGKTSMEEIQSFYRAFPWQGALLFPFFAVMLTGFICRANGKKLSVYQFLVIWLFASAPTYNFMSWTMTGGVGLPYGWIIFYLILFIQFKQFSLNKNKIIWLSLLIFFMIILQPAYHTVALMYLLIVASITVTARHTLKLPIILYGTIYLAFLMYYAIKFWDSYLGLAKSFVDLVRRDAIQLTLTSLGKQFPEWWTASLIINYFCVALPTFLLFGWIIHRIWRKKPLSPTLKLQFHLILSLITLASMFFVWNGIGGVIARAGQVGTLISIISLGFIFSYLDKWSHHLISTTCLIAILFTTISYLGSHVYSLNSLTHSEWAAVKHYGEDAPVESVLFTDFRIGATTAYVGHFNTIGLNDIRNQEMTEANLKKLFYDSDGNAIEAKNVLKNHKTMQGLSTTDLLISEQMTRPLIGIALLDDYYIPLQESMIQTYNNSELFNKTYSSGSSWIYSLNP